MTAAAAHLHISTFFLGAIVLDLVFANPLELIAIAAVPVVGSAIAHDDQATWFEGVMLVSVYAILGLAFFYVSA